MLFLRRRGRCWWQQGPRERPGDPSRSHKSSFPLRTCSRALGHEDLDIDFYEPDVSNCSCPRVCFKSSNPSLLQIRLNPSKTKQKGQLGVRISCELNMEWHFRLIFHKQGCQVPLDAPSLSPHHVPIIIPQNSPSEPQAPQKGGNAGGHWATAPSAMGCNHFAGHEIIQQPRI